MRSMPGAPELDWDDLRYFLRAAQATRVRLAVPSGWANLFAGEIAQLQRDQPGVSLELVSGARPADLKKGEADLALRSGPVADADLVVRSLVESGFSVYASQAYLAQHPAPAQLDDLTGHALIGFDAALAESPAAKWLEARASSGAIVLRSREMADMLAAAISGVGIAVIPCFLGDAEPRLVRLTPEVVASRRFSLVYRREAKLSPHVRAVASWVVEVVQRHARRIAGLETKPP